MTNDDTLLAGFLDRSLSEDQLLDLEARKAASPEFAHQFSNMLTLESMLASATPQATIPAHFLNAVENTVAAKVLVGGASGGFLSGLSSMWSWLGGAALALVTAGSIYYVNQPSPVAVVRVPPTVNETIVTTEPSTTLPEPPAVVLEESSVAPSDPRNPARETKNEDPSKTSNNMKTDGGTPALLLAVKEYEAHVASSDHVNAALKAITIGLAYRADRDLARSEYYFAKAADHARTAKLAEQEIIALGEYAVTANMRGNETQARLLLNQAILRGSQTGIDVSVWTQKLKDLR